MRERRVRPSGVTSDLSDRVPIGSAAAATPAYGSNVSGDGIGGLIGKLLRRVRDVCGDLALIVTVTVHLPDALVVIRERAIEQFPFTVHFCLPREVVLKMELVLTVVDGFNAVTFHLAVGFVAATTTRGGTSDETVVTSASDARAAMRNRLFCRLLIQNSVTLQLQRGGLPGTVLFGSSVRINKNVSPSGSQHQCCIAACNHHDRYTCTEKESAIGRAHL